MSVVKLIGGAAVLGALAGVGLSMSQPPPDPQVAAAEAVEAVMPLGTGARATPENQMVPDPLSLRGLPEYPGAQPRRLTSKSDTQLSAISWFSTTDSLDSVLTFYESSFAAANLMYTAYRWPRRGYASWFEHTANPDGGFPEFGAGVLHMVSAFDEGSQTMVLLSASDPMAILEGMTPLPPGVAIPEGARPQVIRSTELGLEQATVYGSYAGKGRDAVAGELEALMRTHGWELKERAIAPGGKVSLVARKGPRVQVGVVEGGADHAELLLTLEERP